MDCDIETGATRRTTTRMPRKKWTSTCSASSPNPSLPTSKAASSAATLSPPPLSSTPSSSLPLPHQISNSARPPRIRNRFDSSSQKRRRSRRCESCGARRGPRRLEWGMVSRGTVGRGTSTCVDRVGAHLRSKSCLRQRRQNRRTNQDDHRDSPSLPPPLPPPLPTELAHLPSHAHRSISPGPSPHPSSTLAPLRLALDPPPSPLDGLPVL